MSATITSILGAAGAPLEFEVNGRTYRAGKLTQKVKAQFEQWLHAAANDAAELGLRQALRRQREAQADAERLREQAKKESDADEAHRAALFARQQEAEARLAEEDALLAEARRSMSETKADIATGKYRFGGPLWAASCQSPVGIVRLAGLLLGLDDEATFELFGEAPEKVAAAVDIAIRQSLPKALMGQSEKAGSATA